MFGAFNPWRRHHPWRARDGIVDVAARRRLIDGVDVVVGRDGGGAIGT